jgi:hypothetical protein
VAQNLGAVRAVDGYWLNNVDFCHRCGKISQFSVDAHGDDTAIGEQAETIWHGSAPLCCFDHTILSGDEQANSRRQSGQQACTRLALCH